MIHPQPNPHTRPQYNCLSSSRDSEIRLRPYKSLARASALRLGLGHSTPSTAVPPRLIVQLQRVVNRVVTNQEQNALLP